MNRSYLSWFETAVNVLVSLVPRVVIAAIAATATRAAMRPYSMAVAPDSFAGETVEEGLHGGAPVLTRRR